MLSRNPGKRDEQSFRINPCPSHSLDAKEFVGGETSRANDDFPKRGRVHFHDALKKKLGCGEDGLALIKNCLLMDAYEPPSADKLEEGPEKRGAIVDSSSGAEVLIGLDRRSYSLTVFPYVDGLVAEGVEPTASSSLGRAMAHCPDSDAVRKLLGGLMLNELITASTRVTDSRIRRAQNAPKQISGHIRYLCLRDGVSFVVDSTSDPYNTSVLAYTFGIRLDQFLLGRMTSRLLEQLGIVAGNKFDNVRGYTSGLKSLHKKDGIQENIESVRHLDEDIVKVKGIYWHASSTGSVRSNELLQAYRDQQGDGEALQLLEEKGEDLGRIVAANAASVDRAISRYTGSFYRFLAGLAFAVVLATQIVSHPAIEKWKFWPYLGLWILLTVGFGLISSEVLDLIERRAIRRYFEGE